MRGHDELAWVLQFAVHCTRGHDRARLLPVGSSRPSHAWGAGAELVG